MPKIQPQFAFVVHSRDRTDLARVFPVLKYLPNFLFDLLTLYLPPFTISTITGLIDADGNEILGTLIGIPMTAHQLLERRTQAVDRIAAAVRLAEKQKVSYIGLGAMTASLSQGGAAVIEHAKKACITTGRTYTVQNICAYVDFCVDRFGMNKTEVRIAIVGAAGGIGFGVALELARRGYVRFTLIDVERKLVRLEEQMGDLHKNQKLELTVHHQLGVLSECDFVIAATSSPEVVIESKDIRSGTIIINDAQPSDVSPDILREREDVLVIEGGVLHTEHINCHLHMGLVQKNDIFSCLAETLLLTSTHFTGRRLLHESDPSLQERFREEAKRLHFSLSPQNMLGAIDEKKLEHFSHIRGKR